MSELTATRVSGGGYEPAVWTVRCSNCGEEWHETTDWPSATAAFGTLSYRATRRGHKCSEADE